MLKQVRSAVQYLREEWGIKLYGSLESGYHGWFFGRLMRPRERLHFIDVPVLARELKDLE